MGEEGGGRADSGSDERPEPEVLGTGLAETTEPVGDLQPKLGPVGYFSPSKEDTISRAFLPPLLFSLDQTPLIDMFNVNVFLLIMKIDVGVIRNVVRITIDN